MISTEGRRLNLMGRLCFLCVIAGQSVIAGAASIHDGARDGDLQTCISYLSAGRDINAHDDHGDTALHVAARNNQTTVAIFLALKGIDIDAKNSDGLTASDLASDAGRADTLALLSAKGKGLATIEATLERRLHLAILRGDLVQVGVRLLKGEKIDSKDPERGWTPLHVAVLQDDANLVELFLALGADPNASDDAGQRPIHFVAELGTIDIAEQLLNAGADVNAVVTNSGATAVQMAVLSGEHDMLRLLLDHGADVNAIDKRGWAPIHIVALKGYPQICRTLLESGADPSIITKQNYTASLIAMASENKKVLALLSSSNN